MNVHVHVHVYYCKGKSKKKKCLTEPKHGARPPLTCLGCGPQISAWRLDVTHGPPFENHCSTLFPSSHLTASALSLSLLL